MSGTGSYTREQEPSSGPSAHAARCPVATGEGRCEHACRCPGYTVSQRHGESAAECARRNGWGPGTLLEGCEGYGMTVIEITAVGRSTILAFSRSHKGKPETRPYENSWTLAGRDWREVQDACKKRTPADSTLDAPSGSSSKAWPADYSDYSQADYDLDQRDEQ